MCRKTIFGVLIFFILGTINASSQDWQLFTDDEAGFALLTPGPPTYKKDTFETDVGLIWQYTYFFADYEGKTDNHLYMLSFHDFPQGTMNVDTFGFADEVLDASIDEAIQSVGGELVYQDGTYLNGHPGRIFKVSYNNRTAVVKSKIFVVFDRFYHLRVFSSSDSDPNTDMNQFLDSFRLLE